MTPHRAARPLAVRLALALAALVAWPGGRALAAPEEIQVYRDDLTPPRGWGLEVNQSYVFSAMADTERTGELDPVRLYRLTPELNHGLDDHWEVGALVEAAGRHGRFGAHGVKLHVRYIAPRPEGSPWYWGVNAETGYTDARLADRPVSAELRGIIGYEGKRWVLALNPTLETAAGRGGTDPVSFEMQSKFGYRVTDQLLLGLESYDELGPVRGFQPPGGQPHTLYAAADYAWRGAEPAHFPKGTPITALTVQPSAVRVRPRPTPKFSSTPRHA